MCSLVTRSMPKWYWSNLPMSIQVFSVTLYTAVCILAFNSSMLAIGLTKTLSLMLLREKKSRGVISGGHGGKGIGPFFPIHRFDNVSSSKLHTNKHTKGVFHLDEKQL